MARFFSYSVFALLLISQLHLSSPEPLTLVAIGVISGVLGIIDFVWDEIDRINEVHGEDPDNPLSIYDLKKQLESMTAELIKAVNNANKVQTLKDRLHEAADAIDQIDEWYKEMAYYNQTFNQADPDMRTVALAEKRVLNGPDGPRFYLRKVHKLFYYKLSENILRLLFDIKQGYTGTCSSDTSLQSLQQIYEKYYIWTSIAAAKTYLITVMAANIAKTNQTSCDNCEDPYAFTVEYTKQTILEKDEEAVNLLKEHMKKASREVWRCDPDQQIEDVTYAELHKLFQKLIIQEHDLGVPVNFCHGPCSSAGNPTTTDRCNAENQVGPAPDPDEYPMRGEEQEPASLCKNQRKCSGDLWDCQHFEIEYRFTSKSDYLDVCNSDQNSNRRYDYLQRRYGSGGEVTGRWGREENCNGITSRTAPHLLLSGQCEVCMCTCAEDSSVNPDEYISLEPVFSATSQNRVVTGARLVKKSNTIWIEIQDGILGKAGTIVNNSASWLTPTYKKPTKQDVDKRMVHKIRWNGGRAINLKDVHAPTSHAIVGLAFEHTDQNGLYLVIFSRPFNFTTGYLQNRNEKTLPLLTTTNKLKLEDCDIPILSLRKSSTNETNKLVEFTTTGLKEDIGQSVIPFFDIQDVKTTIHTPMSGAGLYYKAYGKYGGFIGLKLHTYDIEPHFQFRPENLQKRHKYL